MSTEYSAIAPAPGWWVLRRRDHPERGRSWQRQAVGCWATTADGEVIALVPVDAYALAPPVGDGYLCHEFELGVCQCRHVPHPSDITDDVWWCDRCPGVIEEVS